MGWILGIHHDVWQIARIFFRLLDPSLLSEDSEDSFASSVLFVSASDFGRKGLPQ
jgi:hypothetical protein